MDGLKLVENGSSQKIQNRRDATAINLQCTTATTTEQQQKQQHEQTARDLCDQWSVGFRVGYSRGLREVGSTTSTDWPTTSDPIFIGTSKRAALLLPLPLVLL